LALNYLFIVTIVHLSNYCLIQKRKISGLKIITQKLEISSTLHANTRINFTFFFFIGEGMM
jgi:hypothetical protein